MKCPECNKDSEVIDSRYVEVFNVKRRRRVCKGEEKHRFTAYEIHSDEYKGLTKAKKVQDAIFLLLQNNT